MAKDAYLFLVPLLVIILFLLYLGWFLFLIPLAALAGFVAFFFRDPDRPTPSNPDAIVSPADGKIIRVEPGPNSTKVVIFLSVFNVHVNRAPLEGRVLRQEYRKGRFRLAFDDRASVENEQMVWQIGDPKTSRQITFSLIAGLVARRIIAWRGPGEFVHKGDRIALIRFGSRVDIFLPQECDVTVKKGDKVYGGLTVLAFWKRAL